MNQPIQIQQLKDIDTKWQFLDYKLLRMAERNKISLELKSYIKVDPYNPDLPWMPYEPSRPSGGGEVVGTDTIIYFDFKNTKTGPIKAA